MKLLATFCLVIFCQFMTAPVRADLVGSSAARHTNTTTAGAPLSVQAPAVHFNRFAALSMLESGDCDTCVGRYGEITRYQILPAVQQQFDPAGRLSALAVAQAVMQDRCSAFAARHGRPPTDFEFYLLWHRPARVLNPTKREADRAQRFANLCSK